MGESLSQQMVLETLVLKFPSNLNADKQATFEGLMDQHHIWANRKDVMLSQVSCGGAEGPIITLS